MALKIPSKNTNDYFQLKDFQDDFVSLENGINSNSNEINALKGSNNGLSGRIDVLNNRVGTAEGNITSLNNKLQDHINQVQAQDGTPFVSSSPVIDLKKKTITRYEVPLTNATNYSNTYGGLAVTVNEYDVSVNGVVKINTVTPTPDTGGDLCIADVGQAHIPNYSVANVSMANNSDFTSTKVVPVMVDGRNGASPKKHIRVGVYAIDSNHMNYIPININYKIQNNLLSSYYSDFIPKLDYMKMLGVGMWSNPYVICTDSHFNMPGDVNDLAKRQIYAINNVIQKLNAPFCFLMGDIITDHAQNTKAEIVQKIQAVRYLLDDCVLAVRGNHDCNYLHQTNPANTINTIDFSDNWIYGKTGINTDDLSTAYYFVDDTSSKIRHIVLNTCDTETVYMKAEEQKNWVLRQRQVSWLANIALNVPEDYHVCVYSHNTFLLNKPNTDWNVINGDVVLEVLKAFRTGVNGTFTGTRNNTGLASYNCTVTTNFKRAGSIVGCFFGHTHADASYKEDGINHITTTCILSEGRADSGINTHVIDVLQVRKSDRLFRLTRLGYGADREFTY